MKFGELHTKASLAGKLSKGQASRDSFNTNDRIPKEI